MEDSEALPERSRTETGRRLFLDDRGPWIFALYWYSFQYHLGNEAPQRAMSFFGLSSTLRAVLLENERTAPFARRFDMRSRILMAICFIPGMMCLSGFIVLCGLPGHLAVSLRDQYPTLGVALVALSLLSLALLAMFTRELYRSFKALFDAYNAPDVSDRSDASSVPDTTDRSDPSDGAEKPDAVAGSVGSDLSDPPDRSDRPVNP